MLIVKKDQKDTTSPLLNTLLYNKRRPEMQKLHKCNKMYMAPNRVVITGPVRGTHKKPQRTTAKYKMH